MRQVLLQKEWPVAGMLVMSLALGIAIAAAVDTWTNSEETTAANLWANSAAVLLIMTAMAIYARVMHWRPFTRAVPDEGATDAVQGAAAGDRLSALLGAMDIGILFMSRQNQVSYCNAAFLHIWRLPPARDLTGASAEELLAVIGGSLARPAEHLPFLLRAPPGDEREVKLDLPMADGRLVTQQSHPVHDDGGAVTGRLWLFEDVTIERRNARQLVRLAERDALTGLYNRHRFNEEMARMVADAQRNGTRLALLFFDLDGLQYINDTFGNRAGDATLIHVAGAVGNQVRRNEIFARLGGDDFALLAPDAENDVPQVLAERVTRSISQAHTEFEGQRLRVSCSCGIALFPDNATKPANLMACADAALNEAKNAGKNTWRFYRSPSGAAPPATVPLSPDRRVLHALENNLLELHYQGIYAARQRALRHYEVLLRVRDPDAAGTMMLTSEFIAMAEKSGRILEIDRWVLGQAIRRLARDSAIPALAVNISGRSLDDVDLPAFIAETLKREGVSARRLLVELTETAAISDLSDARRFIEALQAMGCGVSLDDFGTGFSSFAYLKHLQVDSIKIDGLFIRDLADDPENQIFVRAIVAVARGLHKTTIAECVEDEASLRILSALGVDYVQGFYLQAPQPDPREHGDMPGADLAGARPS